MEIRSGYPFYGQQVGVIVFSNTIPRVPGDPGHAGTFRYPVRYEVAAGSFDDLIEGGPEIRGELLAAGRRLTALGIRAIVGDCGLMSLYQDCLGAELGVLFAGSSLCQIPLIWQLAGRQGEIGVITGHAGLLSRRHLRASGWTEEIPLIIQGMEEEPHFSEVVIRGGLALDPDRMRRDVLAAGEKLRQRAQALRAVILECSNLATYSADLCAALGLPVLDTVSAANLLAYGVAPPQYL